MDNTIISEFNRAFVDNPVDVKKFKTNKERVKFLVKELKSYIDCKNDETFPYRGYINSFVKTSKMSKTALMKLTKDACEDFKSYMGIGKQYATDFIKFIETGKHVELTRLFNYTIKKGEVILSKAKANEPVRNEVFDNYFGDYQWCYNVYVTYIDALEYMSRNMKK